MAYVRMEVQRDPARDEVGNGVETAVVFTCVTPAHQAGEGAPDKLTIHEGKWAFCPFDARAESHEWKPNGGLTLSMLQAGALARAREHLKSGQSDK